jgi:hypothetical protein
MEGCAGIPIRPHCLTPTPRHDMPPAAPPAEAMEPGQLLKELEQRQDEVLAQLDELDAKLRQVLLGLGVTLDDSEDDLLA